MTYELEEDDRQATLLALAELALSRPGWDALVRDIAAAFQGVDLFEKFKIANADRVHRDSLAPGPEKHALRQAALGAHHLCLSLLAYREGATDDLIQSCVCALDEALLMGDAHTYQLRRADEHALVICRKLLKGRNTVPDETLRKCAGEMEAAAAGPVGTPGPKREEL